MADKVHIVLASDANYLPGLEVTRASILRSCKSSERLVWHVFDEETLSKINVSGMPKWNGSHMPYLRLWLPEILHDVDWVVYADVDTVWNRDVCELHDVAAGCGRKSVCWVRDFRNTRRLSGKWIDRVAADEGWHFDWSTYACSGVCVMNLKKLRMTNFTGRVLELFAKYGVPQYPDQDVMNVICNRDSGMLSSVWNAMGDCSNLPPAGEQCVYHITGVGRHFHDERPPVYPPQYQLWWNVRTGARNVHGRSRILAALWPLHGLANLLPLSLRERVVRQWFFAKALVEDCL